MALKLIIVGCLAALIGTLFISQLSSKKQGREFRVNLSGAQVFLNKAPPAELGGGLEKAKSGGTAEFGARTRTEVDSRPRLTVPDLMAAMTQVLGTVPSYVPNLPFMTGLARVMLVQDPQAIRFEPMPANVLGYFTAADPGHPRIALSSRLQDLYLEGLPVEWIVPVLVHELDHMLAYMQRRYWGRKNLPLEEEAFASQYYYLYALRRKLGDGFVDARPGEEDEDAEVAAYKREMRRIRKAMLEGKLPQLVRELYAPKTAPGQAPAPESKESRR